MAIKKIKPDYHIGIFVLLIFVAFTYYNWSLLDNFDSYLYSTSSRLVKSQGSDSNNVVIVNLDYQSIRKPSKDSKSPVLNLKELTARLTDSGVKLIAFSIPFESNQTALVLKELRALSEDINAYPPGKKYPEFKEWMLQNIDDHRTRIISNSLFPDSFNDGSKVIVPVSSAGTEFVDPGVVGYLNAADIDPSVIEKNSVHKLVFPYPELLKKVAGYGYIERNGENQPDGFSYKVYVFYKGSMVPSLALRMAIFYNNLKPAQVKADQSRIVIKDNVLPLINGRMYVPASDSEYPIKTVNYMQIMGSPKEISGLKDKVVIIGFKDGKNAVNPDASLVARQFIDIISRNTISRAPYIVYLEACLFVVLILFLISSTSSKGFLARTFITIFLILLIVAAVIICFNYIGIWLKAGNIICGIVFIYLLSLFNSGSSSTVKRGSETSRILGLNFQSQGELDLAYEEFKTLPLDKETKDLIYNLGLEYENKNQPEKALELYVYINKGGSFRDLDDRIPMLRASDYSSTMGSYGEMDESSVLSDSSVDARTMVGRYKILGKLGKGSMGLVYKAQDPKINRLVAIKTIRFSDEFDEDVIKEIKERFFREAEIAGKLNHPAIVTIHDVGDDRDLTYMAMEYLEGEEIGRAHV